MEPELFQLWVILPLKQALWLVQSSFANVNLMKIKFWGKYQQKSVWLFVYAMSVLATPISAC